MKFSLFCTKNGLTAHKASFETESDAIVCCDALAKSTQDESFWYVVDTKLKQIVWCP